MLISAADVALMARVQRPVVTVWQRRYAGTGEAFPTAVDGCFDAEDVAAWLIAHGRGNNPHPERTLPLLAMLSEARSSVDRAMELSATLAFRSAYGEGLLEDLEQSAADVIPRVGTFDELQCFEREVVGLAGRLSPTVTAVEEFLDERYGAADAMAWLTDSCLTRHLPGFTTAALSPEAAQLVASAAVALGDLAATPSLLDAAGTGFSWLQRLPGEWGFPVGILVDESPVGRHSRRILQVGGWDAQAVSTGGGWSVAVDAAFDVDAAALFSRAALGDDSQMKLVLGPSRLLADDAGDLSARDELLRDGVVRAVVKLPVGCRPAHPREALALWVVAERDELPFAQHRTFVADLTGVNLTTTVISDLVADLCVAAQDVSAQDHRAWRVLRPALTRHLLARGGSLVASAPTPIRRHGTALTPEEVTAEAAALGLGSLSVAPGPVRPPRDTTVQAGLNDGWLKFVSGSRISVDTLGSGDLPVWSVGDGHLVRTARVDRLIALGRARTWLTQPGDVIVGPGPSAVVDTDGGSLVATPARALRLTADAPVTAQQLARAVASSPRGTKPPQWRLTPLDPCQREAMSAAADKIGQRRAELTALLDALNSFEDALLDACETTTITLETH